MLIVNGVVTVWLLVATRSNHDLDYLKCYDDTMAYDKLEDRNTIDKYINTQ